MEQAEADRAVSQMSSDEASDGKHRVKEEDKEFWKRRRKQWKENMKTAKASFMTKEEYMNSDLFARRREREETKKRWRSLPLDEMKLYPPDIVIDLEYDADMPDKDLRSLASQLMHAYGFLRKSERPVRLHLARFCGAAEEALRRVNAQDWKVARHPESFHQVFDKSRLVYLSPDATDVLTELSANDVYVIGGLVDDNKLLNKSFNKATELGIRSARLPINEHSEGTYANLSLCVNQVFNILVDVAGTGKWKEAFEKHIPERFKISYRSDRLNKKKAKLQESGVSVENSTHSSTVEAAPIVPAPVDTKPSENGSPSSAPL